MINKIVHSLAAAVSGIHDGSVILIGGFGSSGIPVELIDALIAQGAKDLTVVTNNAGSGWTDVAKLLATGRVHKIVCSYPRSSGSVVFEQLYAAGKIELELVPQGTLSERMRAAGAGIGGFYTRTGRRNAARARQGNADPRWLRIRAGEAAEGRCGADQSRTRRPLGQSHLSGGRAQFCVRPWQWRPTSRLCRHAGSWSSVKFLPIRW